MPVFQLSWFELLNTLTILIVLVIINRLFHALRILNSRVEILSSLVKNLKHDLSHLHEDGEVSQELQEYINQENALSKKMGRDFSVGKTKSNSRFSGNDLTRSNILPEVKDSPPPKKSRFKRLTPTPSSETNEKPTQLEMGPIQVEEQHEDHPTGLASLHTLSSTGMDAVPTHSNPMAVEPEPHEGGVGMMTVQDGPALSVPPIPPEQENDVSVGQAPKSMTYTDLTQKKMAPVAPDSGSTLQGNAYDSIPTTTVQTIDPEETVRGNQSALQVENAGTVEERHSEETQRMAVNLDLLKEKEPAPEVEESTQRNLEPVSLDDLFADLPKESNDNTAVSHPPESPSQEGLIARYNVEEEGSELRIKKDLSYLSKTPSQEGGKKKSFTREQIPSLSLLRDQEEIPPDLQALIDAKEGNK